MSMKHIFTITDPTKRLETLSLFMRIGSVSKDVRMLNEKAFEVLPDRKTMESKKVTKAKLIDIIEAFGTILNQNVRFASLIEQQFGEELPEEGDK